MDCLVQNNLVGGFLRQPTRPNVACPVVSAGGITGSAELICARFIGVFESAVRFP
jgi:hypothetical protein